MTSFNHLNKNPSLILFFILLVLAFLSRFYGIWLWDLVGDENFTATLAHERYKSFVNPAYYSLVVAFYNLFGQEHWISRLPALILSIISIPVLYFTWSKAIGRNAALLAAVILIFSAWHLWYSQFARHYMGVFLFSSVAYCFFYRAVISDRISYLMWALAFSLTSILFHATAVWVPASSAAAYLAILILNRDKGQYSLRIIKIYLIVCVISAISISPLIYKILDVWLNKGASWGYGATLIVPQLAKYIQIPIVISAFFGWLLLIKKEPITATFFSIAIGLPILFLVVATPFMAISPAYAYSILPLVIILSGIACEEIRKSLASTSMVFSLFTVVLLITSLMPAFVSHYLDKRSLNFNSVIHFLEKNHRQGDNILSFVPGFHNKTEKHYETLPFISFERDTTINWGIELKPLLASSNRTWIIISSKRNPLAPKLENWLLCNARLVWQKHAVRIDYEVSGYQIFLAQGAINKKNSEKACIVN